MDFAFRNITFDMKQLVEVLRCDLQVTIQEGLMETQTELLETVARHEVYRHSGCHGLGKFNFTPSRVAQ